MRRRDVATAAPRSVGLYRVRMAEGVKSTPSDALPLPLFPSPSFTVTLNCLHVSFSRDYRYIFLLPKPTPFFLFVSSKGILGDIRYRLFFFSFIERLYWSLPSLPFLLLPSFLPRTSILSPYWLVLHPPCSRLYIHVCLSYSFQVPTLARHSARKRVVKYSRRLLTRAYLRRV